MQITQNSSSTGHPLHSGRTNGPCRNEFSFFFAMSNNLEVERTFMWRTHWMEADDGESGSARRSSISTNLENVYIFFQTLRQT